MKRDAEIDRYRGCLLGLATGDALGTTLEFRPPGSFEPIADMVWRRPLQAWSRECGRATLLWRCAWLRA